MADDPQIAALLVAIRDLLIPVAAYYQPGYEEQLRKARDERAERFPKIVRGTQARNACVLMDGTNSHSVIRAEAGIASGNLSLLVSRLDKEGYLETDGDRLTPKLIFSPQELKRLFGEAQ